MSCGGVPWMHVYATKLFVNSHASRVVQTCNVCACVCVCVCVSLQRLLKEEQEKNERQRQQELAVAAYLKEQMREREATQEAVRRQDEVRT